MVVMVEEVMVVCGGYGVEIHIVGWEKLVLSKCLSGWL